MIVGVGIDICSVERMRRELDRSDGFETCVFTASEISEARRLPHTARRFTALFAAKEAVVKALAGAESVGTLWRDIVIDGDDRRPRVTLNGRALTAAESLNVDGVRVTFSHTRDEAVACAFATSSQQPSTSNTNHTGVTR